MADPDEGRIDVIIALLGRLVANSTDGDQVVALNAAGLKTSEIARILDMKSSAVSMRVARAKEKTKK